jgi:hypothetical protein
MVLEEERKQVPPIRQGDRCVGVVGDESSWGGYEMRTPKATPKKREGF